MPVTIYGIKNCDTMKKARAWLDDHGVTYDFHDYKAEGIARDKLKQWSGEVGWETLLNRAGTTFRKLPDGDKEGLDERKALALMLALLRGTASYDEKLRSHANGWDFGAAPLIRRLRGATFGIVGLGRIGLGLTGSGRHRVLLTHQWSKYP